MHAISRAVVRCTTMAITSSNTALNNSTGMDLCWFVEFASMCGLTTTMVHPALLFGDFQFLSQIWKW